ncbi:unnamed protein product, partial [Thelazia callipaeda]|uniref:DB domain-containing protein n=1 Tax=Thelazia callipaeda TaxID=103827 RepID=A0A0N5CS82_THECL
HKNFLKEFLFACEHCIIFTYTCKLFAYFLQIYFQSKQMHFKQSKSYLRLKFRLIICGVAPDFLPCVTLSEANSIFSQCCLNKLPIGCQQLCKYDVTKNEIKEAIVKGLCRITYVVSILACASDGHDNSECCKYKAIAAKSGPQCEAFCRPEIEIKELGMQHLVCQRIFSDLVNCHMSGLKRLT